MSHTKDDLLDVFETQSLSFHLMGIWGWGEGCSHRCLRMQTQSFHKRMRHPAGLGVFPQQGLQCYMQYTGNVTVRLSHVSFQFKVESEDRARCTFSFF